jgi:ribosomal protein S18 acetylase RimI-like enzyme
MISYRLATTADIDQIASLHAKSWKETYRGSFSDYYLDHEVDHDRHKVWSDRFSTPNDKQHIVIAEDSHELIGIVCTFIDYHPSYGCYLDNLHVRSGYKGTGIGKRLMHESARYVCTHRPNTALYLWVLEKNVNAIKVYEKLGGLNMGKDIFTNPGGGSSYAHRIAWPDPTILLL